MASEKHKMEPQISMAAGAIALRGVKMFLDAGRAAATRNQQAGKGRKAKTSAQKKCPQKCMELLLKVTNFDKSEVEALFTMYKKLVIAAQAAACPIIMGQPPPIIEGIDQNTFRDVMHNTFDLVTEESIIDRIWIMWDRGTAGGEGALKFESWTKGLSVLLKGSFEEKLKHCFTVYDLNSDGFITKDEMFALLKNALLKQPGDEDPDEGVRDLVELILKKLDMDKDGKVSFEDYKEAVQQEPLLMESFGLCLPPRPHVMAFLRTLTSNK